jgi:hypothetical protein
MVHGHAVRDRSALEEACSLTTMLEESSQVICLLKSLGSNPAGR